MKALIILTNIAISGTLVTLGMRGMVLRDPWLGTGYEWSTLMWILGLVTACLVPLEICVIKSPKKE